MSGRLPVALLAAWNLFVWGGRFRNLIADPGGLADANRWSLVASIGFSVVSLIIAGLLFVAARGGPWRGGPLAVALAVVGIAVWAYRGIAIAFADHGAGFVAIHSMLAIVTIGLGVWVLATQLRIGSRSRSTENVPKPSVR